MTTSTTPNDTDLIKHCIRTLQRPDKVVIEVEMISWPHPHRPASEWTPVLELPGDADRTIIDKAIQGLLHDKTYFGVCGICGRRYQRGHMMGGVTCHGCAERHHGVVF